jgi:hypothetical protein
MDGMTTAPAHAKPKDHLWVLAVIAAAALAEVWASWVGIGSISGFPDLGRMHTDWILAVVMEAYWAYALYAWLAASPGPKSRAFAMRSCAVVFALSLIGQVAYHEMTVPPGMPIGRRIVVGFVTALPVTVLAMIAVLIHLRHADRADAVQAKDAARNAAQRAAAEAAAADERTALRAQLEDALAAVAPLQADLETMRNELARVTAKAEAAAAKLEAMSAQRKRKRTAQRHTAKSAQEDDLTTEMRALTEMEKDPELRKPRMGGELARRLGVSASTGRRLHTKLTTQDRSGESLTERSAGDEHERSDERS